MLEYIECDAGHRDREPRIIFLGDIVDRGPYSRDAIELVIAALAKWPASRLLLGNHDDWYLSYLRDGDEDIAMKWVTQGGIDTRKLYRSQDPGRRLTSSGPIYRHHIDLFARASLLVTDGAYAFVHAGVNPGASIDQQSRRDCLWIRNPFLDYVGLLSHVIVHGHTPLPGGRPVVTENRISLDTGAFATGILTAAVIDIEAEDVAFVATSPDRAVSYVEPDLLDLGGDSHLPSLAHPIHEGRA